MSVVHKLNSSQDGLVFSVDGECQTLSSGHGNVPKILINGGGKNMIEEVKQINPSKESGGKQPYMQNCVYDENGIAPALSQLSDRMNVKVKSATKDGFEIANEGDSINLSNPNYKTRRGRVGKGQSQTLDTGSSQVVIVKELENKFRLHKDDYCKSGIQGGDIFKENCSTMDIIDNHPKNIINGSSIRRLTEIECERLQGLPDNHTKFGNYDGVVKEISKTQRYKLCGNAVTSSIVKLIGLKLLNP